MLTVKGFTDGASRGNPGPASFGIHIIDDRGGRADFSMPIGEETNNVAEYYALLICVDLFHRLYADTEVDAEHTRYLVYSDSELCVKQINGEYAVNDSSLFEYHDAIQTLCVDLDIEFHWIPRAENHIADSLANAALDRSE